MPRTTVTALTAQARKEEARWPGLSEDFSKQRDFENKKEYGGPAGRVPIAKSKREIEV